MRRQAPAFDIDRHALTQLDAFERRDIACQGALAPGAGFDEVEEHARHAPARQHSEILDRAQGRHASIPTMVPGRATEYRYFARHWTEYRAVTECSRRLRSERNRGSIRPELFALSGGSVVTG